MYSFPSVPSHFHLEIVNTANLSSGLSWLKCRSQKDSTVSNGIFQAQLNNSPENVIRKVTSVLEKSKIKYGMVMTGEVLYLHPIRDLSDEMTSISSRAMLGIFSTSDRNKFLYMKKKGLEKIFSEHSYSNEDSDMFNREFRNLYL